jgi:hypothetical protein
MTVYVDQAKYKYGRMIMCHMVATSEDELHAMVDLLGIDRRHFQCPPKVRNPHYDICKSKRDLALSLGAQEVSTRELIAISKAMRS